MPFADPNEYFRTHSQQTANISNIRSQSKNDWYKAMQPLYDFFKQWQTEQGAMTRQKQQQEFEAPFKEQELALAGRGYGIEEERLGETKRSALVSEGLAGEGLALEKERFGLEKEEAAWKKEYDQAYLEYLKAEDSADRSEAREQLHTTLRGMMEAYGEKYASSSVPKDVNGNPDWSQASDITDILRVYETAIKDFLNNSAYSWLTKEDKTSLVATSTRSFQNYLLGYVQAPTPDTTLGNKPAEWKTAGGVLGKLYEGTGKVLDYAAAQRAKAYASSNKSQGVTSEEREVYDSSLALKQGYEDSRLGPPQALLDLIKKMEEPGTVDVTNFKNQLANFAKQLRK